MEASHTKDGVWACPDYWLAKTAIRLVYFKVAVSQFAFVYACLIVGFETREPADAGGDNINANQGIVNTETKNLSLLYFVLRHIQKKNITINKLIKMKRCIQAVVFHRQLLFKV